MHLYRICEAEVWAQAQTEGALPLSELDRRDGYVHLSTAAQVPGTLHRFFAGRDDLVVLTISRAALDGAALRFEAPSHAPHEHAELFPHFYGRVTLGAITRAEALTLGEGGHHRLPDELARAIAAQP
ncbi:hypothetical protein ENSA5_66010 [Enhygromyxa salina]|uniref:DUF952 domain-containing protein n=1 Tax=Enhygromyxa salina TaxID=215803 RepID=A0A2S9XBS7_9BACT|nr:DUF952 domain-containing protein [Enhygromyxa salina]PRP90305.1 hypothetical protein ENSA5_66010 [Enhygromyxa salina]